VIAATNRLTAESLQAWFYRIGVFLMLNVLDEPAYLALMFC
jgi:hypothetical protein